MRTLPARPRPYYYGWNVIGLCMLAQIVTAGLSTNCFSLFVPLWSDEMGVPDSTILLAIPFLTVAGATAAPLVGWACDRVPVNRLMTAGLLFTAVADFIVSYTTSAVALIVTFTALLALGLTLSGTIPAQAAASRWFERKRGFAMGLNALGMIAAGTLLPPIVVHLLPMLGWRHIWQLMAAIIGLVIAPIAFFALYDHPAADDPFRYVDPARRRATTQSVSVGTVLRRPNFWLLLAVFFCVLATNLTIPFNIGPIVLSHGLDLGAASLVVSLYSVSGLVGNLGFGALADRFGNRTSLVCISLTAAAGAAALMFAGSRETLYLAIVPVGLAGGIWTLLPAALAAEFGTSGFGRAYGLANAAAAPVATTLIPLLAWIKEQAGSYQPGFAAMVILALTGAAATMFMRQPKTVVLAEPQLEAT